MTVTKLVWNGVLPFIGSGFNSQLGPGANRRKISVGQFRKAPAFNSTAMFHFFQLPFKYVSGGREVLLSKSQGVGGLFSETNILSVSNRFPSGQRRAIINVPKRGYSSSKRFNKLLIVGYRRWRPMVL